MLRPTSVSPDGLPPCSSGMTATGSHVDFYSLRGAQPQGEGFGLCEPLAPTAPHPAGIMIPATFPQGKASLRRVGTLLQPPTVHPLSLPLQADSSPYTPGAIHPAGSAYESQRAGHAAPLHAKTILRPAPTPDLLFSLIKIMPLPELSSGERF